MSKTLRIILPVLLAWPFVPGVAAQTAQSPFVGCEWLASNLGKERVRIVDMRADIRDYWESHIPGAVFLDSGSLRWAERGVPVKLMPVSALALLLGEMGIDRETKVVVYSEINHYRAAYFVWALDYIKHKNWALLEGGFERWKKEGKPVDQNYPAVKPVLYPVPASPDSGVRATLEEVRDRDPEKSVLFDVRSAELYSGEKGSWKRKGHIKGALNRFWILDLKEDGSWRLAEGLRGLYESLGATPDKTIIVSCGQGQMAAHTYIMFKYILGYSKVKNYDGSFNEWSVRDELPVETGTK